MMLAALWEKKKKKKKKKKNNNNNNDDDDDNNNNNNNKTELDEAPAQQETVKAMEQLKSATAAGFDVTCFTLFDYNCTNRRLVARFCR